MSVTLKPEVIEANLKIFQKLKRNEKLIINEDYGVYIDTRYFQFIRRKADHFWSGQPSTRETTQNVIKLTYDALRNHPEYLKSAEHSQLIQDSLANLATELKETYPNFEDLNKLIASYQQAFTKPHIDVEIVDELPQEAQPDLASTTVRKDSSSTSLEVSHTAPEKSGESQMHYDEEVVDSEVIHKDDSPPLPIDDHYPLPHSDLVNLADIGNVESDAVPVVVMPNPTQSTELKLSERLSRWWHSLAEKALCCDCLSSEVHDPRKDTDIKLQLS